MNLPKEIDFVARQLGSDCILGQVFEVGGGRAKVLPLNMKTRIFFDEMVVIYPTYHRSILPFNSKLRFTCTPIETLPDTLRQDVWVVMRRLPSNPKIIEKWCLAAECVPVVLQMIGQT